MGAGMIEACCSPMTELTNEGKGYKDQLTVLMFAHLGVAIAKIILMGFMFGFGDIF